VSGSDDFPGEEFHYFHQWKIMEGQVMRERVDGVERDVCQWECWACGCRGLAVLGEGADKVMPGRNVDCVAVAAGLVTNS
jgi:hypothetical protein